MITCRRAVNGDTELFREIRLRALKDSPEAFGSTYELAIKRDFDSWRNQIEATVSGAYRNTQFAFEADQPIGIAALYREDGADTGDIIMMWVSPESRGTEAATRLVENLLSWASDVGMHEVCLNVTDTNERAIRFYEKCGFTDTRELVDCDVTRNLKAIRMAKKIV